MFRATTGLSRQLFGGGRSLSSVVEKKADPTVFVLQRKAYQEQLKAMRKVWTTDINARNLQIANERAAQKEKVVLAKAMGLREKRKQSALRQAADKEKKANAAVAFSEHIAKNLLVHEERQLMQAKRHEELSKEYTRESQVWLTSANVDERITAEFFDAPSTTGLVSIDSEHWRYAVHSINLDRFRSLQTSDVGVPSDYSLEERMDVHKQNISSRHLLVQDFLDPLISTGAERAQYRDLLKKFSRKFDDSNAFSLIEDDLEDTATFQADLDAVYERMEGNAEHRRALLGEEEKEEEEPYDDPAAAKQEANRKAALQAGKGRVVKGRMARKQVITKKK